MAAPFFLFQPGSARWVSIAAGVAYGLWCIDLQQEIWSFIRRSKQERSKKQDPWTVDFFVTIFQFCGAIMALGTALIFFFGWLSWAYDLDLIKRAWPVTAVLLSIILGALVWFRHHANIRRILRGEEPKIGARSS